MRHSCEGSALQILLVLAYLASFVACGGGSSNQTLPPPARATSYYLDCSSTASGSGTQGSPWNSLTSANAFAFQPGDSLLLKRGTTCSGSLVPQGSGKDGAPIIIDAYGTGARPIIDGGMNEEAIRLLNQQYWEINNLEVEGGNLFGIYVSGDQDKAVLNHIYFRNLDVHGAHYASVAHGDSGELLIHADGTTTLNDILIDGISAHDSLTSDGIQVIGAAFTPPYNSSIVLGSNVTIQNSTAHDVCNVGILVMSVNDGFIQNNVGFNTGLCPHQTATDAIGCVTCANFIMQNNESYANQADEPYDGGGFALDTNALDSIVQYNYGHDSMGYCIGHFAGPAVASLNNVIRYNVCSNDGQKDSLSYQGEIVVSGGSFDGVQIYNNTFYWNPVGDGPAIYAPNALYSGTNPNFFKNNIIYSTAPTMINMTADLSLDNNIYWTTSGTVPTWQIGSNIYAGFTAYQAGTGRDSHSFYVEPMMDSPTYHEVGRPTTAFTLMPGSPAVGNGANVCTGISGCSMGNQDFWGNALPNGSGYSIGAYQPQ
ncbi:MAG: hypothetical protein WB781_22065 [Candidatus Sulfotelmatobacter sp.]